MVSAMQRRRNMRALALLLVGCAAGAGSVAVDPGETGGSPGGGPGPVDVPDVRCSDAPDAGPAGEFRHFTSEAIAALGSPKHRGTDLVVPASTNPQVVAGWISYTTVDKALEDEDVDVFVCRQQAWQKLGTARTDGEGHFALAVADGDRFPIGMRDLYVSVVGDRTDARFLAYVAPDGTELAVSDIDGTLTASENAFLESLAVGGAVGAQPDAAGAFTALAAKRVQPVYLSARGSQYTSATRDWLDAAGFPRGPVRLAESFVTLPGGDTVAFKTQALRALDGFALAAGIGNRDSDVQAYAAGGVPADRIFVKLPEYQDELAADLSAGAAVGFTSYQDLRTGFIDHLP
jgi:phosphatidate phosphatase PAH1